MIHPLTVMSRAGIPMCRRGLDDDQAGAGVHNSVEQRIEVSIEVGNIVMKPQRHSTGRASRRVGVKETHLEGQIDEGSVTSGYFSP